MEDLIKAMSIEELGKLKETYKDNPSIIAILDGYMESKQREVEEARVLALRDKVFIGAINKVLGELPGYSPEWRKDGATQAVTVTTIEIDDESQEQVTVMVDGEPNYRYPKKLVRRVAIGVAVTRPTASGSSPQATKRAITVFKRSGTTLEPKGNYPSASKACEALGLVTGGDSATRVLARDGYIIEPYDGMDFAS